MWIILRSLMGATVDRCWQEVGAWRAATIGIVAVYKRGEGQGVPVRQAYMRSTRYAGYWMPQLEMTRLSCRVRTDGGRLRPLLQGLFSDSIGLFARLRWGAVLRTERFSNFYHEPTFQLSQ